MFLLKDVSPEHHKLCQDQCKRVTGDMLKCMNVQAVGQKPCKNVIHAACAGYDSNVVPYLTSYYCTDCTTSNSGLHDQMDAIEQAAKEAAKKAATTEMVSKVEFNELQGIATQLEKQLNEKITQISQQEAAIKRQREASEKQAKEIEELKEMMAKMQSNPAPATVSHNAKFSSTLFDSYNETLRRAEGLKINNNVNASSIHQSIYSASNTASGWPDYEEQQQAASMLDDHTLMLIRSSLAKPIPFEGDVTKWATFLSEFVRTSQRGHYREYEDIDRLRELVVGEAREMFVTELSDPGAEALATLKRLDEFFGVRGNAVRVSVDRITQLQKIEKASDKQRMKNLYTSAKQFALQCKIHAQEYELASEASVYILESKMCSEQVKSWRNWVKNNNKKEDVDGIIAFLEDSLREMSFKGNVKTKPAATTNINATEVTALEDGGTEASASTSTSTKSSERPQKDRKRSKGGKKKNRYADCECFLCREKHPFYKCPQLIAANDFKRTEIVSRLKVCTRCLCSNKHAIEDCHNRCMKCYVSGCTAKNKHPLLHGHSNDLIPRFTSPTNHVHVNLMHTSSHFAMVPGSVKAADGTLIPITLMFDGGSGISLSTYSLFERAQYESIMEYELTLRWATDMTHVDSSAKLFNLQFIPYGKKKAIEIKNLTAVRELKLPEQEQDPSVFKRRYSHLASVPIPAYKRQSPQILLGLNHAGLMAHLSSITSKNVDEPVAALTGLGWVLYGNCHDSSSLSVEKSIILGFTCSKGDSDEVSNDELLKYIRASNDVENLGIAHKDASLLSANDQQAQKIIDSTMKFIPDLGRYEIGLLWAKDDDTMPDNYEQAVSRLISTENRLVKLGMLDFVKKQFEEQIEKGWLVETTREEAEKYARRNYVYGFLTFNKNKKPPKPRWVNDTAGTFKGVSLNTKLLKGPDNLVPLPQAMCSAREGPVAYQADVKSMFNQVLLRQEDQFSQLTLWRAGDQSAPPKIYRQTRVIFGPACSPSETSSIRIDHADKCKEEFPEAADVAKAQMYVDDVIDSRNSVETAVKVANDLITMFERIGWPLIEFQSNSSEFLSQIPASHVSKKMTEIGNDTEELITKVLGIFWKPTDGDVYIFRLNDDSIIKKCTEHDYRPTKKEILSTIMRLFDPLGFIAPFRIRGHIIMQHVWRAGTEWRQKPPKEICEEFAEWLRDFERVTKLEIPRAYANFPLEEAVITLHVFVDAGSEAYGAGVYIHIERGDEIIVRLIAAKARVAPLKYMSIPRLELMSALIGARLFKSVLSWHRRLNFSDYTCWTDSDVSFKWIKSRHLPRTAFSAPRISEIQELTSASKWRYVPSAQNVADYATKCRSMDYSDANHEWLIGPRFLYQPQAQWPKQPKASSTTQQIEATINVVRVNDGITEDNRAVLFQVSAKVRSNWPVLVRVVAKALRFVDHLLPQRPHLRRKDQLTRIEIERAENYIIRLVQKAAFPDEFETLAKEQKIRKSSAIFSLIPTMCEETSLIRATTRLSKSFPLNMRRPPVMPNFHEITDSIVKYYHEINAHVGDHAIAAQIRSRMWIVNGRRAIRRCRARCLYCIEKRIKPGVPNRADLPDFRLDIHHKPFFHVGSDLFGPYTVYRGRSKHKMDVHIVIFTCMVTRAIYMEVLDDKSTECFLTAFEKAWARLGPFSHVYSDCGLNYVGAERVIARDELQKATSDKKIQWHFCPPYTPQFAGPWERLIKDCRRALDASIGKFIVPRLSVEAAIAKIELNMNNRPLTEVPVSSQDDIPLSPYLLMRGFPNYPGLDDSTNPELTQPPDIFALKPARRIQALVQAFRHRFLQEYAPVITRRPLNKAKAKYSLRLNDYVIYLDPTKNPAFWPRGIIIKTYPGKDRAIRVVDIKLKDGRVLQRRSAYRVAKLDIRLEDKEAESDKYQQAVTLLVNSNSNWSTASCSKSKSLKLSSPCNNTKVSNLSIKQQQSGNFNSSQNMENSIRCRVLQGDSFSFVNSEDPDMSVQLTEEEKHQFIDRSGKRLILARNFPPNLGAGDVFAIMNDFGTVNMIACKNWTGRKPFSCIVGYEDSACADSAFLADKSQLVWHNNKAYRQTFEKMTFFNPAQFIQKSKYTLLDMTLKNDITRRALIITTRESTRFGKPIPISGNSGAYINFCPLSHYYEEEKYSADLAKDLEAVRKIPCKVKPSADKQIHREGPVQIITRQICHENGSLIITVVDRDPFDEPGELVPAGKKFDLRQLLNSKRELESQRNILAIPQRASRRSSRH